MLKLQTRWCAIIATLIICNTGISDTGSKKFTNIGFIKSPSNELKKKFPMCDEFLDIKWVSREKGIGEVRHDIYKDGKQAGQMHSLVYMNENHPYDRLELYSFEKNGELENLFKAIRNGEVTTEDKTPYPNVIYGDYSAALTPHNVHDDNGDLYSYSNFSKQVCAPFPKGDRMWIIESRSIETKNHSDKIKENIRLIHGFFPEIKINNLQIFWTEDLNNDGIKDIFDENSNWIIFSKKREFDLFERKKTEVKERSFVWNFKTNKNQNECNIKYTNYFLFISTDGSAYFLNNQCNLSEVLK